MKARRVIDEDRSPIQAWFRVKASEALKGNELSFTEVLEWIMTYDSNPDLYLEEPSRDLMVAWEFIKNNIRSHVSEPCDSEELAKFAAWSHSWLGTGYDIFTCAFGEDVAAFAINPALSPLFKAEGLHQAT